ncbi:MAG TPA: hypothetical protein VK148_29880, partial [Xanthobacteraceae bacterium]|nr:hypothetical protein [Xanthobacteraceae bacterium]
SLIFNRIHHMATPHSGVRASPAATLGGKDGRSSAVAQRCEEGFGVPRSRGPSYGKTHQSCTPNTRRVAGLEAGP